MNDAEFMRLLSAAHRAGVKKIGERLARERKNCLQITRAREIALNPDVATPEETAQIARCPHCAKLVEQMKAGLTHPSLGAIVRWLAGAMEGDEAKQMHWHMVDDGCRRCNRLARSPMLNGLVKALHMGTRTAAQVQALTEAAVGFLVSLPAGAPSVSPDGKMAVSVQNSAANELVVTLNGSGQEWCGGKASVELIGETGTLSNEVVLHSQGPSICEGRLEFGPVAEVAARLGQDYSVLIVPQLLGRAEELTLPHRDGTAEGKVDRSGRVWGIKLGSGGAYVAFCERHQIVGLGWQMVDPKIVATGTREQVWSHVKAVCPLNTDNRAVGKATGQLFRFGQECEEGDYVLYYNPGGKCVRICRVVSGPLYRGFELGGKDPDIWHYRKVEYPVDPIPILDLHGSLKGSLLGPRMSFWDMGPVFETVDQIARGESPHAAANPELEGVYRNLEELVIRQTDVLTDQDWEWLVVDYLKAQGAYVDERFVGGTRPIIDTEAVFDHGELGIEVWRVQVKRRKGAPFDWPEIEHDYQHVGDANFCFVSVFGFTEQARQRADEEGVRLLEAGDFVRFLLGGKLRPRLRDKLRLPFWTS